jgi:hypothetical protein
MPTELINFNRSKRIRAEHNRSEARLLTFISIVPCLAQFWLTVQFPYAFGLIAAAG